MLYVISNPLLFSLQRAALCSAQASFGALMALMVAVKQGLVAPEDSQDLKWE